MSTRAKLWWQGQTREESRKRLLEGQERFRKQCGDAKTPQDVFDLAEYMWQDLQKGERRTDIFTYQKYIGYALPHRTTCERIVAFWKTTGNERRVVDLGCGSGVFCYVLHFLGIPKECLMAVDLPKPTHDTEKYKPLWTIHREDNYRVYPKDILFIAWGTSGVTKQVEQYVEDGGDCVIILGETDMTFACDYFAEREDWSVTFHHAPSTASLCSEYLAFNQRIKKQG